MKPEELFIGAWVYNAHHKKNIQITPYDFFTHRHDENGVQHLKHHSIPRTGNDLYPIPITPEILKKNGFVEIKYPSFSDPKDIFYEYELPSYKFKYEKEPDITDLCSVKWCDFTNRPYIIGGGPTCNIRGPKAKLEGYDAKYVHELQAAMRLCGLEEEIIL